MKGTVLSGNDKIEDLLIKNEAGEKVVVGLGLNFSMMFGLNGWEPRNDDLYLDFYIRSILNSGDLLVFPNDVVEYELDEDGSGDFVLTNIILPPDDFRIPLKKQIADHNA